MKKSIVVLLLYQFVILVVCDVWLHLPMPYSEFLWMAPFVVLFFVWGVLTAIGFVPSSTWSLRTERLTAR